jgi:hypothetical protein
MPLFGLTARGWKMALFRIREVTKNTKAGGEGRRNAP